VSGSNPWVALNWRDLFFYWKCFQKTCPVRLHCKYHTSLDKLANLEGYSIPPNLHNTTSSLWIPSYMWWPNHRHCGNLVCIIRPLPYESQAICGDQITDIVGTSLMDLTLPWSHQWTNAPLAAKTYFMRLIWEWGHTKQP